jgi:hypothetical protein
MCPLPYYTMIHSQDHRFDWRLQLVMYAQQFGRRAAARAFRCCRNTVAKWLGRYQLQPGRASLLERSRAPRRCPHKTPPEIERQVLAGAPPHPRLRGRATQTRVRTSLRHQRHQAHLAPARSDPSTAAPPPPQARSARSESRLPSVYPVPDGREVPHRHPPVLAANAAAGAAEIPVQHPRTGVAARSSWPTPTRSA